MTTHDIQWPTVLNNAWGIDFESYHPTAKKINWFYWNDGLAQHTGFVAVFGMFDPEQKGCTVLVWTPTPLRREIKLTSLAVMLLEMFGGYVVEYASGKEAPAIVQDALDKGYPAIAHNVQFDARAFRRMDWGEPRCWYDSMHFSRARLKAGSLEDTLQSIFGTGKAEAPAAFVAWHMMSDAARWKLLNYCAQDAIPTTASAILLTERMTNEQVEGSRADFIMNDRGLQVDAELARGMILINDEIIKDAVRSAQRIDPVFTKKRLISHKFMTEWLAKHGLAIYATTDKGKPSIQSSLVERLIDGEYDDDEEEFEWTHTKQQSEVIAVLKARLAVNGIFAAKASAAVANMGPDGRIHDYIAHAQAHPGRAGGRDMQPQNLPKPRVEKKDIHLLAEARELVQLIGREVQSCPMIDIQESEE